MYIEYSLCVDRSGRRIPVKMKDYDYQICYCLGLQKYAYENADHLIRMVSLQLRRICTYV